MPNPPVDKPPAITANLSEDNPLDTVKSFLTERHEPTVIEDRTEKGPPNVVKLLMDANEEINADEMDKDSAPNLPRTLALDPEINSRETERELDRMTGDSADTLPPK